MKRIRYRLLARSVTVFAVLMAVFGGVLLACSFEAGLAGERAHAREILAACATGIQNTYAAYKIQGADMDLSAIQKAAEQYDGSAKVTHGRMDETHTRLFGRMLIAETGFWLGDEAYTLSVGQPLDDLFSRRENMLAFYRILYILFLPVGIFLMYGAGRSITRPIESLTETANALSCGNLDARSAVCAEDEIGALSGAFNRMADSLQGEIARREMLIGSLAHEMKTPLQAIIGHADLIRMDKAEEELRLNALRTILHEANRLNRLSSRMLEWVKMDAGEIAIKTAVDVRHLLENVQDAFASRIPVETCADAGCILADAVLMEALLSNLVDNAVNAGAGKVSLWAKKDGVAFVFRVEDDGCGMGEEALLHLEEPFYREDKSRSRAHGGAGLGLALCARIAQLHETKLSYTSEKGCGTCVSFRIAEVPYE